MAAEDEKTGKEELCETLDARSLLEKFTLCTLACALTHLNRYRRGVPLFFRSAISHPPFKRATTALEKALLGVRED